MLKLIFSSSYCAVFLLLLSLFCVPLSVSANPQGGQVVGGDASVSSSGNTMNVQQNSDRAIINWNFFDIGKHESVIFNQPSSSSAILNRIRSGSPSEILGNLKANGQVYLVNPDGFVFGDTARIDTSGFMATTSDIMNDKFMKGNMDFNIPGTAGAQIINKGMINVADCGFAALVAPIVRNEGIIAGRYSRIALASGENFQFDGYGDNLINFAVSEATLSELYDTEGNILKETGVYNEGHIQADGGLVLLKAQQLSRIVKGVVSSTGVIEARTVERHNGRVIFGGERDQDIKISVSGKVDVSGETESDDAGFVEIEGKQVEVSANIDATGKTGGRVHIMGDYLWLENALIDASGYGDGGTVLIGGDYLGGRASDETYERLGISRELYEFDTATNVAMMDSSVIKSDSLFDGDGGKIVLWADNNMFAYGDVSSSAHDGNGGFIEVSGVKYLDIDGLDVEASSLSGERGTVLFDPAIVEIVSDSIYSKISGMLVPYPIPYEVSSPIINMPSSFLHSVIKRSQVTNFLNNGLNVVIECGGPDGGGITVYESIVKGRGGDASLTLSASVVYLGKYSATSTRNLIASNSGKLDIIFNSKKVIFDDFNIKTNGGLISSSADFYLRYPSGSVLAKDYLISDIYAKNSYYDVDVSVKNIDSNSDKTNTDSTSSKPSGTVDPVKDAGDTSAYNGGGAQADNSGNQNNYVANTDDFKISKSTNFDKNSYVFNILKYAKNEDIDQNKINEAMVVLMVKEGMLNKQDDPLWKEMRESDKTTDGKVQVPQFLKDANEYVSKHKDEIDHLKRVIPNGDFDSNIFVQEFIMNELQLDGNDFVWNALKIFNNGEANTAQKVINRLFGGAKSEILDRFKFTEGTGRKLFFTNKEIKSIFSAETIVKRVNAVVKDIKVWDTNSKAKVDNLKKEIESIIDSNELLDDSYSKLVKVKDWDGTIRDVYLKKTGQISKSDFESIYGKKIDSDFMAVTSYVKNVYNAKDGDYKTATWKDVSEYVAPTQCVGLVKKLVTELTGSPCKELKNGEFVATSDELKNEFAGSNYDIEVFTPSMDIPDNIKIPTKGSIMSFKTNSVDVGHVAIVKNVTPIGKDGYSIELIEQNLRKSFTVSLKKMYVQKNIDGKMVKVFSGYKGKHAGIVRKNNVVGWANIIKKS
ncbi:filamentous hemagglutinin family N-terminal domain-containing protein [Maridesulfovibrio ferrireducens]|uniref:Filamentous hemagglutinin family N-terminal domain-containing protein n=1 Tax=Maridesulfovibrio ferrireducens TaxID=246191 RepID=A0A1G9EPV2_9BACT|nr:filamentous hemagglutinin N-terminal domain-containing protein [Maridesulfovibrio ferrireducens]SDK78176.1 filamentous hemagglutinin family N-terminal domain-containing protein [Maridesulfovibrio ferrireducens]